MRIGFPSRLPLWLLILLVLILLLLLRYLLFLFFVFILFPAFVSQCVLLSFNSSFCCK